MSENQFLSWAETQEGRYELVEGFVMMQAGATRRHETIAKQIFVALFGQIDERTFDVNKGDFGVKLKAGSGAGSVLYPDVLVDLQSADGTEKATETPIVVIEVLSRSTDYEHHKQKLERYRVRPSLRQYVVFEQDFARAYVWKRTEAGWPPEPTIREGLDAVIAFPEVGAQLALADIYGRFEPDRDTL